MHTIVLLLCALVSASLLLPAADAWTSSCSDPYFKGCYGVVQKCPAACPKQCEVDCTYCKPICACDKPGAVCQDPRFIGGDGIMFYFHGKKDADFCIVSDTNLHINAHFIGKSKAGRKRDFTWVQSLGIMFGSHQLYIGANKVAIWDDSLDQITLTLDTTPVLLPAQRGASWASQLDAAELKISRIADTNAMTVELPGSFKLIARVVPILEEESRIHGYGITPEDCFAHLEINFKFFGLSDDVTGVLGQTYAPSFRSPVKVGVAMPIMGGESNFAASALMKPDCAVSKFKSTSVSLASLADSITEPTHPASISCASELGGATAGGRGIVCRR
ncbi:hypothetical protein O6H91_04G047600 [Diphasiastrum complanatum]|uniref:Uncharacterized protein n=1 Tax=Diphasiastrum complanatum TaxID=34168 RepID=A0ACC2DWI7_DIPCM|nr:hypothetical protein O6H91_04G047600 [Diphasiastrum complanatum]